MPPQTLSPGPCQALLQFLLWAGEQGAEAAEAAGHIISQDLICQAATRRPHTLRPHTLQVSQHYMFSDQWSEVMSLGPGEVMTPAQCLNNDQHLHRCQQVRWGSHHRVTIISFLICQHCAIISDDAPTGYCKSSLCDSLDNSLVLLCGLIDSSGCDSSGRSQVWTIHHSSSSVSPPQWPPSSGSVLILDRLSPLSF